MTLRPGPVKEYVWQGETRLHSVMWMMDTQTT